MDWTTITSFMFGFSLHGVIGFLFHYSGSKKTIEYVNGVSHEEQTIPQEKVAEDLRRIDNKHKIVIVGEGIKTVSIYPKVFGWRSYPHEHGDLMHDRDLR